MFLLWLYNFIQRKERLGQANQDVLNQRAWQRLWAQEKQAVLNQEIVHLSFFIYLLCNKMSKKMIKEM